MRFIRGGDRRDIQIVSNFQFNRRRVDIIYFFIPNFSGAPSLFV